MMSFRSIYDKVQSVLGEDTVIKTPRVCGKQTKRANPPSECAFEYFKRSIFLPYLDTVLFQLRERFSKHKKILKGLFSMIPSVFLEDGVEDEVLENLANFYKNQLPGEKSALAAEFKRWELF